MGEFLFFSVRAIGLTACFVQLLKDDLPWSRDAIHVSARKQSKWWFAKRFLHPDVVEPYDFVFLWDEDIDVETDSFDANEYLRIARANKLHISQPSLVSGRGAWPITSRVEGSEMHRRGVDWNGAPCPDAHGNPRDVPPCAAYVEIMVPGKCLLIIVLATRMTPCFVNSVQQTGVAVRPRHDPERSDARVGFGPDLAPVRGGPGR